MSAWYAGLADGRAWRRVIYLLLAYPRGLAYFIFLVVGFSTGIGLAITLLGLPILLGVLVASRALAVWERRIARALLDLDLPDPHRPLSGERWLVRLGSLVSDPSTWKDVGYLLVAFPLGILDLVAVAIVGWMAMFIALPIFYWAVDYDVVGLVSIDTLPEALVLAALGVVLLPIAFRGAAAFASVHAAVARLLLTSPPDPELTARVVDLQSSRARMVAAADAERRRLERDLHDGAQQRLVSLSLNLGMARQKLSGEKEAMELLERAGEEAKTAIAELRDLARGIHPVVLSERGLGPALVEVARRAPVPVEVSVLDERLPEALEVTAYFVVSEALTNVAKYAEATQVTVGVRIEGPRLIVEVADDGRGGANLEGGSGLRGLTDRVAALEGELELHSPPGEGTRLRVTLPVEVIEGAAIAEPSAETTAGVLDARSAAIVRIRRRRALITHAAVFAVVELALVLIWALTSGGYFWPAWPLLGWGLALGIHAAVALTFRPLTEAAVEREPGGEAIAVARFRRRRALATHAAVFAVVELALIAVWALAGGGYVWPVWPLLGWGLALGIHAAVALTRGPVTEADVARG